MALPTDWQNRIQKEAGIRTLALGPEAHVQVNDPRYVSDAYQYFLNQGGGQDAATMPATTVAQDPTTMIPQTGGQGITSASAAQNMGGAGGAQNPLTQIPVGQTQTVKQLMTSPEAYSLPGESDPFLASGAAGGARLPVTQATTTLPSGDIFATDDPRLPEQMDYTQQDPSWWESARDKFVQTGQDVSGFFGDLKNKGIDVSKMAGSAIMNMVAPGAGLLMRAIPEETPIDKFNRQYALGGDLYQNVVSQVDDPKFEGRLEGYADDLIAGTGEGKDPFGKNTVSLMGNYPAMATDIYNELTEKAKTKELSQFDKDRLDYYGHVSGLTGKTNIPGTPLMTDTSPLKTFPEGAPEDVTILPEDKPIIEEDVIKTVDTIAGNKVFVNENTGELFSDEVLAYESLDPMGTGAVPPGEKDGPGYIEPPTPDNILADTDNAFSYLDVSDEDLYGDYDLDEIPSSIDVPAEIEPFASDFGEDVDIDQGFVDTTPEPTFTPKGGGADRDPTPKSTPTGPTYGPHGGGGADRDPAPSAPVSTAGQAGPPSQRGGGNGGNGGGGGKIVCTMMNESYGFGSFRNKIWLKHSKDLAPEYQIGYHKIFLPLVRLSKTNKLLKKTLEHIAVHRTIDIRQEARGKVHLLGRVYRKILEPICYWVGKYAKR